jgi:hypothetical protein
MPLSSIVFGAVSGSVTPPYGDMSTGSQNNICMAQWTGDPPFPAGYYCVTASESNGQANLGDYSAVQAGDSSDQNSEYVYFDQSANDGVSLQPPIYTTISMATSASYYGPVSGYYAYSGGYYSAESYLKVMWSYTYYNSQTQSNQTVNYFGTLADLDQDGGSVVLSCPGTCTFEYAVSGNPPSSLWVGGGMASYASSATGYSACSWFDPNDPTGLCETGTDYMSILGFAGAAWSISLSSMRQSSSVAILTATASADVSSWDYAINIFDQTTSTLVTSCTSGTTCTGSVSESGSTTQTYIACVAYYESCSSDVLASAGTSVTWPLVSISTQLSSSSITAGGSAHDTANLSNQKAHASGSVKYAFYSGSSCSGTSTTVSNVTVTNGVVPPSKSHTFNTAGSYSWQAVYSGDSVNNGATSQCESLTVTKANPSLSTALSTNVILPGGSVYDTATLSGETGNAGGTVTYSYTSGNPSCNSNNPVVVNTVTVTNGLVPPSNSTTFPNTGFYYWWAVYSGDSNNKGATGPCEVLYVGETGGGCVLTGMSNALVNETLSNDMNTGQLVPTTLSSNSGPISC